MRPLCLGNQVSISYEMKEYCVINKQSESNKNELIAYCFIENALKMRVKN